METVGLRIALKVSTLLCARLAFHVSCCLESTLAHRDSRFPAHTIGVERCVKALDIIKMSSLVGSGALALSVLDPIFLQAFLGPF